MSDSEVLTLAIAGQWRVGVPWQSERGLIRYINAHACAAHNFGLWLNRRLGRPLHALATLLC